MAAYDWTRDADRTYRRHLRPVEPPTTAEQQEQWARNVSGPGFFRGLLIALLLIAAFWIAVWAGYQLVHE